MKLFTLLSLAALLAIAASLPCSAQKQGNIWYFGDGAGLDFNSGGPVPLLDGKTYLFASHAEAASAISDSGGRILFYSNGEKVWNRRHQVMPNGDGLLGSFSSTQGALIVPSPFSDHRYYLFTSDGFFPRPLEYGLRYSVIDLCLDDTLGDVVPDRKNIPLLATAGEKLCATMHADGSSVWVVTHEYGTDAFHAFLLTGSGIADTVVSHVGARHRLVIPTNPDFKGDVIGQMKISPDGRKLALCNGNSATYIAPAVVEFFDFDNATGKVSNCVVPAVLDQTVAGDPYGVAFSPDSRLLYISRTITVMQYDLGAGDSAAIAASGIPVLPPSDPNAPASAGIGMQLGPDGRIYASTGGPFLDMIARPNQRGAACDYRRGAVDLQGRGSSMTLPSFIDSYRYRSIGRCMDGRDLGARIPELTGRAGDRIEIPIVAEGGGGALPRPSRRYTATIAFDRTLLFPRTGPALADIGTIEGDRRVVRLAGTWSGASETIGTFGAIAGLGTASATPLELRELTLEDGEPARLVNGRFSLLDVCYAGGARLLDMSRGSALRVSPDPAPGAARVGFTMPESGRTRIYLTEMSGRRVATIVDGEMAAGTYEAPCDLGGVADGIYMLVMEAPGSRISRPIRIGR